MTIHLFSEVDSLKSGDLLYRYEATTIFPAYLEDPERSLPGLTSLVVDAETVNVIAVAQVIGASFRAFWIPYHEKIEVIPQEGVQIASETVARRLFPAIVEYTFKGK